MNATQIVASYLILQATGTAAWWALLMLMPSSIEWFKPASWPVAALLGFWLADFLLIVAGSLTAAVAVIGGKSWAAIAVWAVAAAVWYPALYCIGVSMMTDEAWIASAMMVSMAGLALAMATIYGNLNQTPASIRVTPMTTKAAVGWTIVQTLIFWSIFLWILPKGITELEHRADWQPFSHAYQRLGSTCLFIGASMLGLVSGMTMAARGDGTPLPTATAPKLVVAGPYRLVRNPMALAGVVQGVAVGWYGQPKAYRGSVLCIRIAKACLKVGLFDGADEKMLVRQRWRHWPASLEHCKQTTAGRHRLFSASDDKVTTPACGSRIPLSPSFLGAIDVTDAA